MKTVSERIKFARNAAGISQTDLGKACGVSRAAVSQWEAGSTKSPTSENIFLIADATGFNAKWITNGSGPMRAENSDESGVQGDNISSKHPRDLSLVWHISWVAAGGWCDAEDPFVPGDGYEQIPCPEPHSDRTIALTVDGPSMDDGSEDGYKDGEIIFVDQEVEARHNSDVVVRTPEGKATFKRLQITSEGRYLLALNPDWPNRIMQVPEGTIICGVVIGSYKRRRR